MSSYFEGRGSFRAPQIDEDVDPMSSLGNIGDIMLVFACGLMVALVLAWNVDLAQFQQVDVGEEIESPESIEQQLEGGGSSYIEAGTVYMDAETGKYYLVEPTGSSASDGDVASEDMTYDEDWDVTYEEELDAGLAEGEGEL